MTVPTSKSMLTQTMAIAPEHAAAADIWRLRLPNRQTLWLCAFAIALLALRVAWVAMYAKSLPFWDEWDAIVNFLVRRYATDTLSLLDLFHPHNEHTIFFTNLIALGELWLNHGQFDNLPVAIFNAILFTATWCFIVSRIARHGNPESVRLPLIACGFSALVPVGWENIPTGFQNAFYFLIAGSLILLWLTASASSNSRRQFAFFAVIALGTCVTMGSGFLASCAALVVCLLRVKQQPQLRQALLYRIAICTIATGCGIFLLIRASARTDLPGVLRLASETIAFLAWPFGSTAMVGVAASLPMFFLGVSLLQKRKHQPIDYFMFGVGTWCVMQMCAIAAGRQINAQYPDSRYQDILIFWPLTNLYALHAFLCRYSRPTRFRLSGSLVCAVATAAFVAALAGMAPGALIELQRRSNSFDGETARVAHYLRTGDPSVFEAKGFLELPYPSGAQLRALLDDTIVRRAMPADVRVPLELAPAPGSITAAFVPHGGTFPTTPSLEDVRTFGSYGIAGNDNTGDFLSQPLHTTFPYVKFSLAGYLPNGGLSMVLRCHPKTDCSEVAISPSTPARESWQDVYAKVPSTGSFRIAATDNSATTWFAFSAPREVGALSMLSGRFIGYVRKEYATAIAATTGLVLLLVLLGWMNMPSSPTIEDQPC